MIMTMPIDAFLVLAALGASALAVLSGPVGSILLWQRRTFLADSLAHSALLGAAIAQLVQVPIYVGVFVVSVVVAVWLAGSRQSHLSEAKLTFVSSACLAFGFIIMSLMPSSRISSLEALLFGDLLLLDTGGVVKLWGATLVLLVSLIVMWRRLLQIIIAPDIAQVYGMPVRLYQGGLIIGISLVIAVFFEHAGVLLLTGLLIIPALTVQPWMRTPTQMALGASLWGVVIVNSGVALSWVLNLPCAPTIVGLAALGYLGSRLIR
jgi:zinc transport system permease protein